LRIGDFIDRGRQCGDPLNVCKSDELYEFDYTDVNITWRNNGKMIPPNYFCIVEPIKGGAFQINSLRNNYFIAVNRSLGEYFSDPPENINVNQLEYHPGDRENKIPPYWTNEYFQNRVWVDDDTKFAIEQTDRLTFGFINRNYR